MALNPLQEPRDIEITQRKQEKSHFHIFIYCLINGQNRNAIVNRPMARILKSYSMSGQPVLKDGEAR